MKDTIYRENAIEIIRAWFETIKLNPDILVDGIISLPSADKPQGDIDAVAIFEHEMHNLEQGYITIGEFDERIEPLRHLCYGRPQGEWIEVDDSLISCKCSICDWESHMHEDDVYGMPYCPNCGARMFAKDINAPSKKGINE